MKSVSIAPGGGGMQVLVISSQTPASSMHFVISSVNGIVETISNSSNELLRSETSSKNPLCIDKKINKIFKNDTAIALTQLNVIF